MKVLIKVWSDNHGHAETFETRPNEPHFVYDEIVDVPHGSDLTAVIESSLRNNIMTRSPDEPIYVIAKNIRPNLEEVRVHIANSEYCCSAAVTF